MRRFLILALIFLTGCGTPAPTEPASFFNPTPLAPALSVESTPEQIRQAMIENALRWTSLQMDGVVTFFADGLPVQAYHEEVWLDPLNNRYKVQWTGILNSADKFVKFSDGTNISNVNLNSGQVETLPYPDSARVGQFVPPFVDGSAHPNPIWGQLGTPLSQLAFPSDYAQNTGIFTPLAIESVAGREALVIEWRFSEGSVPTWKMWLDTQTATILRLQEFGKNGGDVVESDRAISNILFNPALETSIFTMPADLPQVVVPTQVGSQPVVTGSGPVTEEEAGELYFFLQPRQTGGNIQLARVSGLCVFDSTKCPPMQIVIVPFAFNFTINALSWSPDGNFAAFSYSDHPDGTPTKLWQFDPTAGTWTSIAEFPYIDPPFWSPDGAWIAFRTQDGLGSEEVHIVRPDGTELKSISSGLPPEGRPYIMDGWYTENIIMRSAMGNTVYLVRVTDGFARPMFDTQLSKSLFVASPDASLLVYDEYDGNAQNHILKVMEPDGANPLALANFTGGSLYPIVWSPDSRLIAFNYFGSFTSGEPSTEVYVVGRDGSNLSSVYKGTTVGRLVFSPNGRYLLVEETTSTTGGHLFLIDLATLEKKMLQAPGLSTDYDWYAPSWRP